MGGRINYEINATALTVVPTAWGHDSQAGPACIQAAFLNNKEFRIIDADGFCGGQYVSLRDLQRQRAAKAVKVVTILFANRTKRAVAYRNVTNNGFSF